VQTQVFGFGNPPAMVIAALNLLLKPNPAKPIKNLTRIKLAEISFWPEQTEEASEVLMDLNRD